MSKQIEVNLEKCTACRICEYACSTHNFGEINPSKSRIKVQVISKDFFFFPVVCKQCGTAPCVDVCPKDALVRNKITDAVEVIEDNCIGCRLCVKACPFGAMGFNKVEKIADKCDLCGGDPECVKHCFYGALEFKDVDKVSEQNSMNYINKIKEATEQEAKI